MNKILIPVVAGLALLSFNACAQRDKNKNEKKKTEMLETKVDSVSYSLGVNIAENLKNQGLEGINVDALAKGMTDLFADAELKIKPEDAMSVIQGYMQEMAAKKSEGVINEGKAFLEENGKRPGVVTLPSGLQYEVLVEGNGPKPGPTDKVTTHYHGMLTDGTVFDSSVERGEPASFPVNGVIAGWTEALQLMGTGSKWKLYLPYHLAYGERGAGGKIGPYATLVFEVELISIN